MLPESTMEADIEHPVLARLAVLDRMAAVVLVR